MSEFANELKTLRKQRGMTLRNLASAAGMDYTYINKLENDKAGPPTNEKIQRLSAVLMCDADKLILLAGRIPAQQAEIESEDGLMLKFLKALPRLSRKQREEISSTLSSSSAEK